MVCTCGTSGERIPQDAQKGRPARPQPKNRPQAYPPWYVEDLFKARTKLADFFSILLRLFDRFFEQRLVGLCIENHLGLIFRTITRLGKCFGIRNLGGFDRHQ